ncbi:MAG: alpha/beta hydrolase, partial [Acidobacteria bacterium]|nr:alpha/beta hydrolase [Acidobacteriota bacterium]
FRDTIEHHLKLFLRLPAFPIAAEVIYWSAWRGDFRAADFDVEKAVERFGSRPILFVSVEGDRRMPPHIARRLFERSASPEKQLLILPGTRHGEAFNHNSERYKQAVAAFLAKVAAMRVRRMSGPTRRLPRDGKCPALGAGDFSTIRIHMFPGGSPEARLAGAKE